MQILTVNLPVAFLNGVEKLVNKGKFDSRSDAVRVAIREFLKVELSLVQKMEGLPESVGVAKPKAGEKKAKSGMERMKIDMRVIRRGWS